MREPARRAFLRVGVMAALMCAGLAFSGMLRAGELPSKPLPAGSKRARFLIKGTVQGVGFRDFTQRAAKQLRLLGWVRNLPSGNEVECVAEGDAAALKEFEQRLKKGPSGAKVEDVAVQAHHGLETYEAFEVRETPK